MWIIYNLLLVLFFSILLMISIFVIEKFKTTQLFLKIKLINVNRLFIEGFIYGLIFLGLNVLFENISNTLIAFWLIGFFILSSLRETTISVVALVPATIYYLFVKDIDPSIYFMYGTIFAMAISFKFAIFFSNNFIARSITYPIFIFVSLLSWLFASLLYGEIDFYTSANEIIFTTIGAILGELIIFWFLKTSVSANILYDSINYAYSKYYRSQIKEKVIGEAIKKQKINKALYIVFNIHIDTDKIYEKREIIETILKDLEDKLPSSTIFFQSIESKYGAFIPFYEKLNIKKLIDDNYNYKPKDNLDFLRILFKKLSASYKLQNNQIINANVSAGISIYGIQGYSLKKLEINANFMLDYIKLDSDNQVAVFDPAEYHKRKKDINDLLILNEAIDLSSLKLKFYPVYGVENVNIATFISSNEDDFIKSISEYIYGYGLIDIYNRYLSASAIIASGKYKGRIAIPYSFKEMINLDIDRFIKRLDIMNFKLSKLVFVFHGTDIKKDHKAKEVINNLRCNGAEIAIISLKNNAEDLIQYFNPEYIFAKTLKDSNSKWDSIFINLENEVQLDKALKKGINKFAGNLISSKSKPHILTKQSKIYIEDKMGGTNE